MFADAARVSFQGVHHVALICAKLEASLQFYQGVLGELRRALPRRRIGPISRPCSSRYRPPAFAPAAPLRRQLAPTLNPGMSHPCPPVAQPPVPAPPRAPSCSPPPPPPPPGLDINPDRPHDKLPYRGAWLWIGPEMIHLMELPNPDPLEGRPTHGGRDRHFCVGVASIEPLAAKLQAAGVEFTRSMSGRPALFFRDPDMNCLECVEVEPWR